MVREVCQPRAPADGDDTAGSPAAEGSIAVLACIVAAWAVYDRSPPLRAETAVAVALLFATLVGGYLAMSVGAVVRALATAVRRHRAWGLAAGPGGVWLAVVAYAAMAGLPVAARALAFAAYVAAPAVLLAGPPTPPGRAPVRELGAVALLWLPIELRLLPPLPMIPPPTGYDASRLVGLAVGLYLFLVARPLPNVGYTFGLRTREIAIAGAAFLVYGVVALPVGVATGFLRWQPRLTPESVVATPVLIYLGTAVPEEFLFRGVIQNALARWWRHPAYALGAAAVVFGLAHLPDPRYVALATLAGIAYGWVYQRTARITAAAVTHALVDAVWVLLLHR